MSPNGQQAIEYAARGWPVFPCHEPLQTGCSCGRPSCASPGKHPRTRNGLHDASTTPAEVAAWWRRWPNANLGVVTGRESGLLVVDIDPRHGGIDSMRRLVEQQEPLPAGPRVRTGSGGWHLLFAMPDRPVRNSAGRVGDGIDVRADGGYVVAPPSLHASGGHYTWTRRGHLPELPRWLAHLIEPPPAERSRPTAPIPVEVALDRWAEAALRGEVDRVRRSPEGQRNHTLNRAAFALGQIAGAGLLDLPEVEEHLRHAAMSVGLSEREATLTIRSGVGAGVMRPRQPHREASPRERRPEADQEADTGLGAA